MKSMSNHSEYAEFLTDLKNRIAGARVSAARTVNREMILLYWDIGRGIVEKQEILGWGKSVVENLSRDLKAAFPWMTGFSPDNLWRMRQFYSEYSNPGFFSQTTREFKRIRAADFLEQVVPESGVPGTDEILEPVVPENLARTVRDLVALVPWGHHLVIMKKLSEHSKKRW